MSIFINELSFENTFNSIQEFESYVIQLLTFKDDHPTVSQRLFISNAIAQMCILNEQTFFQLVQNINNRDFKQRILRWITKSGPFWGGDRQEVPDDYFELNEVDVTELGLGEAARRLYSGINASTFSVEGNHQFNTSPLIVQHGLSEDPIGKISVDNLWDLNVLASYADSFVDLPNDWETLFQQLVEKFPNLIFADDLIDPVGNKPFYLTVRQRAFELLSVLDAIVVETIHNGKLTARGVELKNKHFVGNKAWFTQESSLNKAKYCRELTFKDPDDHQLELFCSWHGKIKTPQFRIHFEWPRPKGQTKIKVVYIGPKITIS